MFLFFANLHSKLRLIEAIYCTAQLLAQVCKTRRILLMSMHECRSVSSELMSKTFDIKRNRNLLYYCQRNEWVRFSRLEAYDSIICVDMKKSLAWLMSALKTRTIVRLRLLRCAGLCLSRAKRKPERTWFVNNANGR